MVGGVRFPPGPLSSQGVTPSFDPSAPPPYLRGLLAVNPNLARDLAADPGLRAFLDANKASLVQWEKPPQGTVADQLTWPIWCHTTNIVPAAVRDEEYIVVVARGSAYTNNGRVQFPLQDGRFGPPGARAGSSDGRIVFVGKTADFLGTQQPADENGHYPGAIDIDITLPRASPPVGLAGHLPGRDRRLLGPRDAPGAGARGAAAARLQPGWLRRHRHRQRPLRRPRRERALRALRPSRR